jgi:hypothetical protein
MVNRNWLLDVAGDYPDAKFTGFDISSDQFPIRESLPSHVNFVGGFDIYEDVPEAYVGKFNVVHARLLFGAVRKNDPLPILRNFVKMLSQSPPPCHILLYSRIIVLIMRHLVFRTWRISCLGRP